MNIFPKIFSNLLNARIMNHLRLTRGLHPSQAGFMPKRESIEQSMALKELCLRRKHSGLGTYVVFIDLKKAYDMVNHGALLYALHEKGVDGNLLECIRNLYRGLECSVRTEEGDSPSFPYLNGLRQGCPLSPTLFNVFIDSLVTELNEAIPGIELGPAKLITLLYADDIAMLASTLDEARILVATLEQWAKKWGMYIGVVKCGILCTNKEQHE